MRSAQISSVVGANGADNEVDSIGPAWIPKRVFSSTQKQSKESLKIVGGFNFTLFFRRFRLEPRWPIRLNSPKRPTAASSINEQNTKNMQPSIQTSEKNQDFILLTLNPNLNFIKHLCPNLMKGKIST